ncbi:MAG: tetratricopeptide repeat protein [Pedobacter sp.]|nr:MAG: tetratricopeptide repeat protein [Pedobacter sp.]
MLIRFFLFGQSSAVAQTTAQQKRLDSLLIRNQNYNRFDSTKVKILTEVYRQYIRMKDADHVDDYVDRTIQLSQQLKLNAFSAIAYYRRGLFYHGRTNYIKAEADYKSAIIEYNLVKNLDMIAGTYLNLGAMYASIPDYAKSLEVNQKAIAIYEKLGNDLDMASCYTNISSIYQDLGKASQSLIYLQMALKVFTENEGNERGVAVVHNLIGSAYFDASKDELMKMGTTVKDRLKVALFNFEKSLTIAESINDNGLIASNKRSIGNVYHETGENELALKSYQRAIQISKVGDDKSLYADCLFALGSFYQKQKDYENALVLYSSSYDIANQNSLLEIQKRSAFGLSDIYEGLNKYDEALAFYKEYITIKDQIFNKDKEREITRRQMQIDFGFKEKDYQFKQKITDIELQRQVLLAKQQQQELFLKKQQLALSDKEKTLQRLTFLKKQVDLEIDREVQKNKFERAKLQGKYETSLRDKQIIKQEQQIKFDWRVKIFLTVAITLVLLTALVIFLNQRKTTRLNRIISTQKRELEQLSRVKDRIFSVVSHDMRTPVNSIISFIQLLEAGNIEQAKLTKYASSLRNNLTYTSTMMENLLNWAASQMQGFNPYLEALDASKVVVEVVKSLQDQANEKGIKLHNKVLEQTKCKADANMLSLIIRNLVSNAIKFTAVNGEISVSSITSLKNIEIKITDNGVGLTTEQINHFNKPGYLGAGVSSLGTNNEKGTGLGLMLCRTFVGLMEGNIKVEQNTTKGTTFTISLPC